MYPVVELSGRVGGNFCGYVFGKIDNAVVFKNAPRLLWSEPR